MIKKILIISCVFPPEPVVSAQISKDLAKELVKQGFDVTVLAPAPSRPLNFDFFSGIKPSDYYKKKMPGVNVIHLKSMVSPTPSLFGRAKESFSFGIAVVSYLKTHTGEYTKVYINSWPLISQYLIARECVKKNLPYLMHIQDIYPESLTNKLPLIFRSPIKSLLLPLENFHLKHAEKIIAISESMKAYLVRSRKLNPEDISVVYNWQDESDFTDHCADVVPCEKFTFMYLGNIGPVAGVETLISSFGKANIPHCRLVIAGSGASKASCVQLASKFQDANILFIEVPTGEVANVQHQADVLLLPVIKGGALSSIPSKLPGYMLSKKPILATLDKESDTAKAIMAAGCGWVGNAEDETWLAAKMKSVYLIDKKKLLKLGNNGYNYSLTNFSKKVNLAKLLNEFNT